MTDPQTFNEKIQWLKLNWRNDLCTICADKYEVRKFIEERIGKENLVELYGVYSKVEEIKVADLPYSFVLKITHGSGQNLLCKDKQQVNWVEQKKMLKNYLSDNLYYGGREWAYKNIPPRIVCEEYLEESGQQPPKDYKFFCFNGKPEIVQVDLDRFRRHTRNMYDMDWNLLDFQLHYDNSKEKVEKPALLEKMIEDAEKLSKGFPFVRGDFYQVCNKVIFGEMTFYPGNGTERFYPETYDALLGSYIQLPKDRRSLVGLSGALGAYASTSSMPRYLN